MPAMDFDIYLLDEGILINTDVKFNRKAGEILTERLQIAATVVVSHQAKVLEQYAQKAAVLTDSSLYFFDSSDDTKVLHDYYTQST